MKRILRFVLAILTVLGLLTGCAGIPTETEPETHPMTTPDVTEPATRYEMGDQIWVVTHNEYGSDVRTAIVVAEDGEYMITTIPGMGTGEDLEALVQALADSSNNGTECLNFYRIENCYGSPEEAFEAAGIEPLE